MFTASSRQFRLLHFILLLFVSTLFSNSVFASDERKDSLTLTAKKRANRAALMSAILPGSGQVYNKKYWKVPIIYGGGAVLAYFISFNNTEYNKYKDASIYRADSDSTTTDNYPNFTDEDLEVRKDYYRRNRDLCYIFAGLLYTLNILDAYVDSQLMDFDVSDNLSMKTGGTFNYLSDGSPVVSLQLVFNFK
jgi:hypothetical protein